VARVFLADRGWVRRLRDESSCFRQKDVSELQDHQAQGCGAGDLQRSASQAAPGLIRLRLPSGGFVG
jgi:hypothetical protein